LGNDMDLTTDEISNYLLSNAFSNARTESTASSSRTDTISTTNIDKTLTLLSGSSEYLDDVLTNLNEMLELAQSITSSSSDEERTEAFAKLRSLSSGTDDILEEITYDDNELFDGTQGDLYGAGTYSKSVLDSLSTTDSLGLATSADGAEIDISYDDFCTWNNALYDLEGLDISETRYTDPLIPEDELDDGSYILEVDYLGANSTVKILDNSGNTVSELDSVDLSGSGIVTLSFDCGVQIDIDKTQYEGSTIDKYDYENEGAAVLYANLDYARNSTYNLTGSQEATQRSVEMTYSSDAASDGSGGTFSIDSVGLASLEDNENELEDGTYNFEIYKIGDTVAGIMYDTSGNVVGSVTDVALNDDGTTTMDFDNGVEITVANDAYSGNVTLRGIVDYSQAVNAYDDFDFEAYAEAIQAAIDTVTAQQDTIDDAAAIATTVQSAIEGTLSDDVYSTTSLLVKNLLGGSSDATSAISLLSGSSTDYDLEWADSLIMQNLSSSLGVDDDDGTSLSSLLAGTTDSIDPYSLPSTLNISGIS
jgi:hypothetical protein